ncbi:hypothetical protein ACWC4D_23735 [Streptomyces sp. NPDC001288]|uniref:hypothetical protein n=1 Tax=unclassified Streptomyces TaxID=2593676 RepID=UPI00332199FE
MKVTHLLLGLTPWVLFSTAVERLGAGMTGYAALAAFLGAVALTVWGAFTDGLKLIDVAGTTVFGTLTVLGLAGGPSARTSLTAQGGWGVTLALAAVMFVSALTVPFTEQYTRAGVHRRYWGSPTFRAVNRDMSMLWTAVILAVTACRLLADVPSTGGLLLEPALSAVLVSGGLTGTRALADKADLGRGKETDQ